jgi:hypothetical protein
MEALAGEQNQVARDDAIVKIDAKLAKMASLVAKEDKKFMAQYLSDILRPVVEKDYKRVLKKLLREAGGE